MVGFVRRPEAPRLTTCSAPQQKTTDKLKCTTQDTLLQIPALFTDMEEISRKYKLMAKTGKNLDPLSATDIDPLGEIRLAHT